MKLGRYRGRHLKPRPKKRGPIVVGTAAALCVAAPAQAATHVVRRGETLSGIAAQYGVSQAALARLNSLDDPDLIVIGQRLRVPTDGPAVRVHVVRTGETLSDIAARYGVAVGGLARANRLGDPNLIVTGQRLKIAGRAATSTAAPARAASSSVSIGSSLHSHAVAHGVDPSLVKAVAWQESGWRQSARSSVGAIGVMQVMPDTARYVNEVLSDHDLNVRDADGNIHLGVMYLDRMTDIMPSVEKALAAYYSGPGNVQGRLDPGQRAYVDNVLSLRNRF